MGTNPRRAVALGLFGGLCLAWTGCGIGQSGIVPPEDRIFFPAGLAVDPSGDWLYVVNSNSDLRFNAGTVVAIDLKKAAADRADPAAKRPVPAQWGRCASSRFIPPVSSPAQFCCRDFVDDSIVNCDERGYVASDATVRIGSFAGSVVLQSYESAGQKRSRLFVSVRAEPSLTFIDVTPANGKVALSCSANGVQGDNQLCDDEWRIKTGTDPTGATVDFQEEPHPMLLDEARQLLYVGHLGGVEKGKLVARGISVIDLCDPAKPKLASVLPDAFPRSGSLGVSGLTLGHPDDPTALYATAELRAEVSELVFADSTGRLLGPGETVPCAPQRDLMLVAGRRFLSTAFGTRGADLRGMVLSADDQRAYVLHRQYADRNRGEYTPASIVSVDRRPDARGLPANLPMGLVEVCNGPTKMLAHDAGRGMRLFVNCFEGGQLYVVEPDTLAVEAIVEVGAGPADLVFAPNDPTIAFVAGFANNNVSVLDLRPGSLTEYRVIQRIGFPRSVSVPR